MSAPRPTKVSLRVPATTANLGPAYDAIGMALSIFMHVEVEVADAFSITVEGEGSQYIAKDETNMIVDICHKAYKEHTGEVPPPLKFTIHNNIPFGCGCGSSSSAAVAGYVAGCQLAGHYLMTEPYERLLSAVTAIEGHPDNAAPAIYGGIQLGYKAADGEIHTYRVPTPSHLSVVLFVPDKLMKASTTVTRGLIKDTVPLSSVVHNISRTGILVLALTTGELRLLKDSTDQIHEMQRSNTLYPHYKPCADAARAAGAEYAFLSGAGPTVCSFVRCRRGELASQPIDERRAEAVGVAMRAAAAANGVEGRIIITQVSDLGVHLTGVREAKHLERVFYANI